MSIGIAGFGRNVSGVKGLNLETGGGKVMLRLPVKLVVTKMGGEWELPVSVDDDVWVLSCLQPGPLV